MMELLSKALSAMKPSKARPSTSGVTSTVSKRWPGIRTKRTRLLVGGVGQRQDFGRHAAFGPADSLALRPPFAPCPWRWTLTMVVLTMAYSMSGVFRSRR